MILYGASDLNQIYTLSNVNVRNSIFGCHGNGFLKFEDVFRQILKYPKNVWPFFIHSNCKKQTFYT